MNRVISIGITFLLIFAVCASPQRVLMKDVTALTFSKNKLTEKHRGDQLPQLVCVGGSGKSEQASVSSAFCKNVGWDGSQVIWECDMKLPKHLALGEFTVTCEGWQKGDAEWIASGTCNLEYELNKLYPVDEGNKLESYAECGPEGCMFNEKVHLATEKMTKAASDRFSRAQNSNDREKRREMLKQAEREFIEKQEHAKTIVIMILASVFVAICMIAVIIYAIYVFTNISGRLVQIHRCGDRLCFDGRCGRGQWIEVCDNVFTRAHYGNACFLHSRPACVRPSSYSQRSPVQQTPSPCNANNVSNAGKTTASSADAYHTSTSHGGTKRRTSTSSVWEDNTSTSIGGSAIRAEHVSDVGSSESSKSSFGGSSIRSTKSTPPTVGKSTVRRSDSDEEGSVWTSSSSVRHSSHDDDDGSTYNSSATGGSRTR